ncbi:MAG: hypothetical protein EBT79_09775 [Actinobacteria bacterium]|nr:hypothetical protein [Actinomycetota bacterium]NBR67543.1 hypothetical protein [Actinomycetota bacterium]
MYFRMTEQVKRRMIQTLRDFWSVQPQYPDLVDHIQGKYSFRERPQYAIILKTSSANQVALSADNYVGTVQSHVMLARVGDSPGLSIEWVREDELAIQRNGGSFPTAPGIYYIEVERTASPIPPYNKEDTFQFYVDPLIDVNDETLVKVDDLTYQTQNPVLAGSMRLYEMPGAIQLLEGTNYTLDPDNGTVTLTEPLPRNGSLSADYRYVAPTTGPHPIVQMQANHTAIPGTVLAFGRRVQAGDKMAVVVTARRGPTALEYGGRWDLSLDFDVVARDVYAQQEIVDLTVMYLWGIARSRLSMEGIEISTVSMGGESEEAYDENADDYYYNATIGVQLQADWSIHVPLAATVRRALPQTDAQIRMTAALSDEELAALGNAATSIRVLADLGLRAVEDPFFVGLGGTYEGIS